MSDFDHRPKIDDLLLTRREMLGRMGNGFAALSLAGFMAGEGFVNQAHAAPTSLNPLAPKQPPFVPKAKRVIFLFMNGGPSHVDTFDPKPSLTKYAGQRPEELIKDYQRTVGNLFPSPFKFQKYGANGIDISELYPHVARMADELCVIRSM